MLFSDFEIDAALDAGFTQAEGAIGSLNTFADGAVVIRSTDARPVNVAAIADYFLDEVAEFSRPARNAPAPQWLVWTGVRIICSNTLTGVQS